MLGVAGSLHRQLGGYAGEHVIGAGLVAKVADLEVLDAGKFAKRLPRPAHVILDAEDQMIGLL
jgi:hypothetical protein